MSALHMLCRCVVDPSGMTIEEVEETGIELIDGIWLQPEQGPHTEGTLELPMVKRRRQRGGARDLSGDANEGGCEA